MDGRVDLAGNETGFYTAWTQAVSLTPLSGHRPRNLKVKSGWLFLCGVCCKIVPPDQILPPLIDLPLSCVYSLPGGDGWKS